MSHQINLFNPALKVKRSWLTAMSMSVLAVAAIAGIAIYGALLQQNVEAAQRRAAASAAEIKTLQDRLVREAAAVRQEPDKALAAEAARLEGVVNVRQQIITRLQGTGVGNVEGFWRYLAALARQQAPGVWLTGVSVNGVGGDIFVRGRALSPDLLPGYIQALNGEEALRGKVINEMQISERTEDRMPGSAVRPGPSSNPPMAPAARSQNTARTRFIEFSLGSRPAAANASTDG